MALVAANPGSRGETMLRVRPIHFTSRLDQWERLLTALGLVKTVDQGPWREFDAGSGRLALHTSRGRLRRGRHHSLRRRGGRPRGVRPADQPGRGGIGNTAGGTHPGGPRRLLPHHRRGRLQLPGRQGRPRRATARTPTRPSPSSRSGSPQDRRRGRQDAADIGARFRPVPDDDETADFTAKNGGVLMVRPASGPAALRPGLRVRRRPGRPAGPAHRGGPRGQRDRGGLRPDPACGQPGRRPDAGRGTAPGPDPPSMPGASGSRIGQRPVTLGLSAVYAESSRLAGRHVSMG